MTPAQHFLDLDKIVAMVREFHEVFGHPVADEPTKLSAKRAFERMGYMAEEFLEGYTASISHNTVGVVDAMADAIYFGAGNLVEQGVARDFFERFAIDREIDEASFVNRAREAWSRHEDDDFAELRRCFAGTLADLSDDMSSDAEQMDLSGMSEDVVAGISAMMFAAFNVSPLEVLTEVHRSNMSKLLPASLKDEEACVQFMLEHGSPAPISELAFTRIADGRWIAKHTGTNKIIKNPLFSEPDLAPICEAAKVVA